MAHRELFTGFKFYAAPQQPGGQTQLISQKSLLEKVGPFTITTLASNQLGKNLNLQTASRKEKDASETTESSTQEREAIKAEIEKLRPIYFNQRIEYLNFSSNPLYSKPVSTMPQEIQTAILGINKKITESSEKLAALKKATQDLKTSIKAELGAKLDEQFTRLKGVNIKFKQIRQHIGLLNEYGAFLMSIVRDFSLYYESLNVDKAYRLQIPNGTLDRITAFTRAYVAHLKICLEELMTTKLNDPEFEKSNYIGEFGEICEHLCSYIVLIRQKVAELQLVIGRLKARFGIQMGAVDREPIEAMNEEQLDSVKTNIEVLTRLFV